MLKLCCGEVVAGGLERSCKLRELRTWYVLSGWR